MTKLKKITIIAVILIVVGAIGCLLTFHKFNDTERVSEQKHIQNQTYTSIELRTGNASVEVVPTQAKVATITLTGKEAKSEGHELKVDVNGQTLSIELKNKQPIVNLDFGSIFTSLSLKVEIPEKEYKSMVLNNDNGHIDLKDIHVQKVKATTDNGYISLKNVASKDVYVGSDNGKIIMENVTGDLKGKTSNGKISLVTDTLDRQIELECDNGRINVQTAQEPTNVRFDVHVDNGRINILDKYDDDAVIGKGENLIKLSTDNGSISIEGK